MNRNTRSNKIGWVVGSTSLLLLISAAGLALFARQEVGTATAATILQALYLASWSYVLGIVGLVFSLAWWLMSWRRGRLTQAAISGYVPAEPRRLRLEEPELEVPQYLGQIEHNAASAVPNRLSRQSDDRNEATSSTRVA